MFSDSRTIPANTVETLDLLNLTSSDLGVSVPYVFRQLRVVRVVNNETAVGRKLLVGVGAGGVSSYAHSIGPGSELVSINAKDSWPVTSANATLRMANASGSSLSYSIYLIGTSTAAT